MTDEQKLFLEERISWSIRNNEKRVWGILCRDKEATVEMRDGVLDLLFENDISPIVTYFDDKNTRAIFLLSLDPLWAFAFKTINDTWEYRDDIEGIVDIYG